MTAAPRFAEHSHMECTFLQPCRVAQFKNSAPEFRANNSNRLARADIRCISQPMSHHVQVFGRRHNDPFHALWRPASKKRQGTKSREAGHRRGSGRYGDLMAAPNSV